MVFTDKDKIQQLEGTISLSTSGTPIIAYYGVFS